MRSRYFFIRQIVLALFLCWATGISAQTTTFTYQGRLTDNSLPPTGIYDMQFKLFDAASGGAQLGATITNATVSVTNGIFTVQLNAAGEFGATAFTGADRYLEVSVRHPGDPGYTTLLPRHQVTSAPYASRSNFAGQAQFLKFVDNRTIAPASSGHGQMQFGFTSFSNNNASPWADYFLLNSFTDASGGNDNLLTFSRSSIAARLWQQAYNSGAAFSSFKDFAFKQDGLSQFSNDTGFTSGSGSVNSIPKFTAATVMGNSSLTDNGTNVDTNLPIRAPIFYDLNNISYYVDPASTSNTNVFRFNTADCINGTCPPNNAIRMTPNLHLNSGAGYSIILNWDNGTTGANQTLRVGNGAGSDAFYVNADGGAFATNWFRSLGSTGWYSQTYGGGWNMTDTTWLRTYNDKAILASGGIAGSGNSSFGTQFGGSPRIFANYDNAIGGGIAISDDGGFYDFNDGWVQFRGTNGLIIKSNTTGGQLAAANLAIFSMTDQNGGNFTDKLVSTSNESWGLLGKSGQAWWQVWGHSFNNASDERIKKDIEDLSESDMRAMLDRLDHVRSVRFRYKEETTEFDATRPEKFRPLPRVGVIAQSMPEEVVAQGPVLGIDLAQTLGYTIAALRGLRAEMREKTAAKDALISKQQAEIDALKKLVCVDHPGAEICK